METNLKDNAENNHIFSKAPNIEKLHSSYSAPVGDAREKEVEKNDSKTRSYKNSWRKFKNSAAHLLSFVTPKKYASSTLTSAGNDQSLSEIGKEIEAWAGKHPENPDVQKYASQIEAAIKAFNVQENPQNSTDSLKAYVMLTMHDLFNPSIYQKMDKGTLDDLLLNILHFDPSSIPSSKMPDRPDPVPGYIPYGFQEADNGDTVTIQVVDNKAVISPIISMRKAGQSPILQINRHRSTLLICLKEKMEAARFIFHTDFLEEGFTTM